MNDMTGIQMFDHLGGGSFSQVYKWQITDPDKFTEQTLQQLQACRELVCKVISLKNHSPVLEKIIQQEINIWLKTDHSNVIRWLYAEKTDTHAYLLFEYWNGGDLKNFLNVHK
jgi:serine/threonine protein kinase